MGRIFFLVPTLKMLGNDPLKLKTKLITIGIPGDGQITCGYYLSWEALTFFLFGNSL